MALAIAILALFGIDNKEFIDTSSKQIKEGNWWYSVPCREATPGLPAITIDSPNGKSYICTKLATSQKEAK
tara:strand:- start:5084 stop:5296 length:213 start_codon:yes stop_codon:yes gene_type:complete